MRPTNPVDFWRGLALVMIFINHVPGNVYSYWTSKNFAISDAAELFVFLAGWSLSYAVRRKGEPLPAGALFTRFWLRAFAIYRAQIVISVIALATLAAAALLLADPIYLEWHTSIPAFYDPVRTTVGLVLMTYQLAYFNILPMYIVLMFAAPIIVMLARLNIWVVFGVSFGIYLWTLVTQTNTPSWPNEEHWLFNPLAWQFLFVLGFILGEKWRTSELLRRTADRLWWPALALVIIGAYLTLNDIRPDPLLVPEPTLLFLFEKSFLCPARILSLLSQVLVFGRLFYPIDQKLNPLSRGLCALGQQSLAVFSVGSVLSLCGQIARFASGGSFLVDTCIVGGGICLMALTAWIAAANRGRSPAPSRVQ
jgi:hypothetical protein